MTFEKAKENVIYVRIDAETKNKIYEALEKQTPKKVIVKHEKDQRWYNDKHLCPFCGGTTTTDCGDVFMDYYLDFCPNCGQALDHE